MIRYFIEMFKFIYKLIHPNYYLKMVQIREISQYRKLKIGGRDNYFSDNVYDWNSLRKSLNIGYIPSILVYIHLDRNTNDFIHHITNGNHRFFILTEKIKETDYIKVWVDRTASKKYEKAIQRGLNLENKIKKVESDLQKKYYSRIINSPNKKRLKNN